MPRTIESIVQCHKDAAARRRVGLPSWAATINVKGVLANFQESGDKISAEQAVVLSHQIAALLKIGVPKAWRDDSHNKYSMDFEDLFERFEQASVSDFMPNDEFNESPCEVIDGWLDELYDWGDRFRVWLGE